jgi:predicted alpha/beta-hydrolase family hydrolase
MIVSQTVTIAIDEEYLTGELLLPDDPAGLVIFAHGSGSSRHSPRNRAVAKALAEAGWAAFLFDLLTEAEDREPQERFDIPLLAQRLERVTLAMRGRADTGKLPIGYFGASTGAAAAIMAAANQPELIKAVVSRGGRPDLASSALSRFKAPTLLIVGGDDMMVIELNKRALDQIEAKKELVIIPGATHLFEEPGALEQVARHAENWFKKYLR